MYYIFVSEKLLNKVRDHRKAWFPGILYLGKGDSRHVYLFDCVISGRLNDKSLSLLLSRRLGAEHLKSSEVLPYNFPVLSSEHCAGDILSDLLESRKGPAEPPTSPLFDQADYFAVRLLGVRGAMRRMEGCFREAVRRRSGVSLLLEELSARELCYAGVAYQLVTCKDSKVFYAVGEKLERAMLLEKYLASSQLLTEFFK
ncbi:MAG: hypothetical protein LM590_04290 [Thermofilum sp.]|nr:hypothetical protein [Thermofilum sp.]